MSYTAQAFNFIIIMIIMIIIFALFPYKIKCLILGWSYINSN